MNEGVHFSHPSTNQARPCLASEIRQDRVRSGWYGRRQECTSDEEDARDPYCQREITQLLDLANYGPIAGIWLLCEGCLSVGSSGGRC